MRYRDKSKSAVKGMTIRIVQKRDKDRKKNKKWTRKDSKYQSNILCIWTFKNVQTITVIRENY